MRKINKPWQWAMLFGGIATAALFLSYFLLQIFNWTGVSGAVDERALRANALYGQLPDHVDAYRWLDESERDAIVGEHVIAARAKMNHSSLLVLVGAGTNEKAHVAREMPCLDIFSTDESKKTLLDQMLYDTMQFLQGNEAASGACACGPMFGYKIRYLAAYSPGKRDIFAAATHHENDTALIADYGEGHFFHAFNVVDELESAYDRLDSDALTKNNVQLAAVEEHQDERYNDRRGEYIVLRRNTVRLELSDLHCHTQVVRMKGALAHCAQRCLDLMRGIDVRERARGQHTRGILLNAAKFAEIIKKELHSEL